MQYTIVPNFKRLGPKVGKAMPIVKKQLASMDGNKLLTQLQTDGHVALNLDDQTLQLDNDDIEVRLQAKEGWAAAQGLRCVVVLNTEVTDELRLEGIANDLIRAIQTQRKAMECEYTDRIEVGLISEDPDMVQALQSHQSSIAAETLSDSVIAGELSGGVESEIDGGTLYVRRSTS